MKSTIIAIIMMVSMLAQTSHAAEPTLTSRIVHSFETSFTEAEDVRWSTVEDLFKVNFILNERPMFAFYNVSGELVVTGKYLKASQLPRVAERKLVESARGYKVSEVFEITDGVTTKYYATLTSDHEQKIMESVGGKWDSFKKSSK